jgi:Flp pilus assembly protein TadD
MKRAAPAFLLGLLAACASSSHIKRTEKDGEHLRMDLAETYVQKKAYGAAIPILRRQVLEHPEDARARTLFGVVLREQGLYPQSEKELREAVRLEPRMHGAWAAMGLLFDLMHRPAEAELAHRAALHLAPASAGYWNNLGFSLYVSGRNDEAIAALEKALALDPGLIVAYNNLGFAYGKRGSLTEAERSFRTAGGEVASLVNMAIVHEQRGDDETAARLRAEAKAKDPKVQLEVP